MRLFCRSRSLVSLGISLGTTVKPKQKDKMFTSQFTQAIEYTSLDQICLHRQRQIISSPSGFDFLEPSKTKLSLCHQNIKRKLNRTSQPWNTSYCVQKFVYWASAHIHIFLYVYSCISTFECATVGPHHRSKLHQNRIKSINPPPKLCLFYQSSVQESKSVQWFMKIFSRAQ